MTTMGKTRATSVVRATLEVLWWLWIGMAALIVGDTAIEIAGGDSPARLDFFVSFDLETSAYELQSANPRLESAVFSDASGKLVVGSKDTVLTITWLVVILLWMTGWFVVLHQLRAMFRSLAAGDPFKRCGVLRIRFIGFAILIMESVQWLMEIFQANYLIGAFSTVGLNLRSMHRPNLELLFLGLVVLAIAELYEVGANMRDEQALTV